MGQKASQVAIYYLLGEPTDAPNDPLDNQMFAMLCKKSQGARSTTLLLTPWLPRLHT